MNIAICDDQPIICDELEHLVDSAFQNKTYEYTFQSFYTGDALLSYLEEHPCFFQIYLLDIEMEGTDGLKTAQKIRAQDRDAIIIFVTSHEELMPKAFRVLAFDFLVKPLKEATVVATICDAIKLLKTRNTLFTYTVKKKLCTLYLSQIEYFESMGRKIIIHTTEGDSVEYYGSLKDVLAKVQGASFAQAYQSYVVNLEKIATIESWHVTMRSGAEINIGKKYHSAFHAAYRQFELQKIH